jgi:hypothetical protein
MAAISVLVHQLMKASSTKWVFKIGALSTTLSCNLCLCTLRAVAAADYPALEKLTDVAIKEKQKFERLVVSKEKLLEMFNVGPGPTNFTHLLIANDTATVQQIQAIPH